MDVLLAALANQVGVKFMNGLIDLIPGVVEPEYDEVELIEIRNKNELRRMQLMNDEASHERRCSRRRKCWNQ